ncbi:MAG: DUF2087 domain-containing protein [Anaerolineales bacterium]
MPEITAAQFSDRFVALVLSARELPKKSPDFNILLYSSVLGLEPGRLYSEGELNAELQRWILEFGGRFGLDHVTLRRHLIDEQYLRRDPAGTAYRLDPAGPRITYDPAIRSLDLQALVAEARQERAKRKQQHLQQAGK